MAAHDRSLTGVLLERFTTESWQRVPALPLHERLASVPSLVTQVIRERISAASSKLIVKAFLQALPATTGFSDSPVIPQ